MGHLIIGIFVGLVAGVGLTAFVCVRRMLQIAKRDPFSSDDPALSRELDRLRGCVYRHIHSHIKYRSQDADTPATRGADAPRWLYLRDGVIFFEDGVATVRRVSRSISARSFRA